VARFDKVEKFTYGTAMPPGLRMMDLSMRSSEFIYAKNQDAQVVGVRGYSQKEHLESFIVFFALRERELCDLELPYISDLRALHTHPS